MIELQKITEYEFSILLKCRQLICMIQQIYTIKSKKNFVNTLRLAANLSTIKLPEISLILSGISWIFGIIC